MTNYRKKYLKYKAKYITLKHLGGQLDNLEDTLSINIVGDEDIHKLERMLTGITKPVIVNIISTDISTDGVEALANFLTDNETLKVLNIISTTIGGSDSLIETNAGIAALSKALQLNKGLIGLNLIGAGLTNKDVAALADALNINESLLTLGLDGNEIGNMGIEALASVLKGNKTLKELSLRNNKIGNDGAKEFVDALEENKTLVKLNLGFNNITDDELLGKIKELINRNIESNQ